MRSSTCRRRKGNAFVKALGTEQPGSLNFLRQEIALSPLLPKAAPHPELLWSIDEMLPNLGTWVAVGYTMRDDVRPIDLSWPDEDVAALVRVVRSIAEIEAPDDPMFLPEEKVFPANSWEILADKRPAGLANHSPWLADRLEGLAEIASHAQDAIAGKNLQHGTLRMQNVLLPAAPGAKALVADWIRGSVGAPYLDLVSMLLHARINEGPPPEATLRRYGLPPGTEPDAVTCWIAVLAGHYVKSSMEPPPHRHAGAALLPAPAGPGRRGLAARPGSASDPRTGRDIVCASYGLWFAGESPVGHTPAMSAVRRPAWSDLPPSVRSRVSETMGGRVIGSAPMSGTEPSGTLEVLQTASGRSIVRAVGPEAPLTQDRMAAEAASVASLPDDVPNLPREWFVDEVLPGAGRWVVLGYRNEPIRPPHDPWDEADLAAAVELAIQIGSSEAPPDLPDALDLIDAAPGPPSPRCARPACPPSRPGCPTRSTTSPRSPASRVRRWAARTWCTARCAASRY